MSIKFRIKFTQLEYLQWLCVKDNAEIIGRLPLKAQTVKIDLLVLIGGEEFLIQERWFLVLKEKYPTGPWKYLLGVVTDKSFHYYLCSPLVFQAVSRLPPWAPEPLSITANEVRLLSVSRVPVFQFYKDQAISHCSCSVTVHLREFRMGEKPRAVCAGYPSLNS